MLSQVKSCKAGGYFNSLTCLLVCLSGVSPASAVITFEKWFGGINVDAGASVAQTTDEGYITTGNTRSYGAGNDDVYLIKTDSLGDTLWTKTFGGSGYDEGTSVVQTDDGGYIVTGFTDSYGAGSWDVYLIKTDSLGDTLWTKTFGGSWTDRGFSVVQTTDKGYIVTGVIDAYGAEVYLIKTDSLGDTLWTKTFGGSGYDEGRAVVQTDDGGYIVTGVTDSYGAGYYDVYLIKTDSLGDTLWTKTSGGIGTDHGFSVVQTTDKGYIVTGVTDSYGAGYHDVYLIKTDSLGDTLWTKTFGGSDPGGDVGYSVVQTNDGGYIVTGYTNSYGAGYNDVYLIKTDSLGDTLWTKTFGDVGHDYGASVVQTTDEGYIVTGATSSYGAGSFDVYLIKTDSLGNVGVGEKGVESVKHSNLVATIFSGSLLLPEGRNCKVFDITGRAVTPDKTQPGIYFIEIEGTITHKVVKIR